MPPCIPIALALALVAAACRFESSCGYHILTSRQPLRHVTLSSTRRKTTALFNMASPGNSDGDSLADSIGDEQMVIDDSSSSIADEVGAVVGDEQQLSEMESAEATLGDAELQTLTSTEAPFFATVVTDKEIEKDLRPEDQEGTVITRRAWLQTGAIIFGGTVLGAASILHENAVNTAQKPKSIPVLKKPLQSPLKTGNSTASGTTVKRPGPAKLEPVNITQVAAETNVNITLNCNEACVSVDSATFKKVKIRRVSRWLPPWLTPAPEVIKEISNAELLIAAIIAGSAVDLLRTSVLYPIQTVKTRIQTDVHNFTRSPPPIKSRLLNLGSNVRRHVNEGNLYAGLKPSLLVSVPATGVYYGIRDVSKRMLAITPLNGVEIALTSALLADVVSLCFRTPADALALRQQNLDDDVGDWFGDSIKRLPSIILTDLPYLLSKIALNRLFVHGSISIDQYTEYAILTATIAALLTTPFDVARTRILIDSDADFSNGKDGGSGEGLWRTMRHIMNEGDGGIANLFAGWLERVLYLGLGRAWLEPIQLIGYVGIRDAIAEAEVGWHSSHTLERSACRRCMVE
eukprot:scaffold22638_cov138-Cylindrotheca_fusiformis.AAC.4